MPGWHAAAKKWVADGKLKIIGLIQEQHPERCQLFAQWQQFDWPIVHDPINLLGNSAVPIAVAIDEHGIVRSTRPNPRTFASEFLDIDFDPPEKKEDSKSDITSVGISPEWQELLRIAKAKPTFESCKNVADAMVLWASTDQLDDSIAYYRQALELRPSDSSILFRLGVAYKMRHESDRQQANDFEQAVDHWHRALKANPNQYIWRRRIQQYGPRLDKPYPFYDWVQQARVEIKKRGEKPVALPVEPVGAELASRSNTLKESTAQTNPDPKNEIQTDKENLVSIETVVVPHTSKADRSSMVHVLLTPDSKAKWSNEAGPLSVWVEGNNVTQSQKLFQVTNRRKLESQEQRKIELEVQRDPGTKLLKGFALYYVCEDDGVCKYLRKDFTIELK